MAFVVLPVAVIEDDTDTIDEEETAGREQDKGEIPMGAGHDKGKHGGHIDPDKGQEERLADGDLPELPEGPLGQFWGGIEEGEKSPDAKGDEVMGQVKEIDGRADNAGEIEDEVYGLMFVGPLYPAGRAGRPRG